MRMKLVRSLVAAIAGMLLFVGCSQSDNHANERQEETATPVKTGEIEKGNFYSEKSVYGKTSPKKQTPVMIEQPGELQTLKVENGDKVKKDDEVATIQTQMGSQSVKAPADGTIAQLEEDEGASISNEEPLMLVVDLDKITASFSVTSTMRDLFKKEKEVTVYINGEKYQAKTHALDRLPDDTGQYPIKVDIDNKEDAILPGMSAQLVVKKLEEKDTIMIPTDAIVTQTDKTFVFIVDGDYAKRIDVDVQHTQSDKTAVKAELDEEDAIITEGQHMLADGGLIDVKEGKE